MAQKMKIAQIQYIKSPWCVTALNTSNNIEYLLILQF